MHSRSSAEHKLLSVALVVLSVENWLAINQLNAAVFGVANDQHIVEAKMFLHFCVMLGHAQFDESQEGIQLIRRRMHFVPVVRHRGHPGQFQRFESECMKLVKKSADFVLKEG